MNTEILIVGAGLAGTTAALELISQGKRVLLLDRDSEENWGGLAKESFGGVLLIDTPEQRRRGIKDSPDFCFEDWERVAEFHPSDEWPKKWARLYCDESNRQVYSFLNGLGVKFLPVVNWPERGVTIPANRVPRWHIAWGTGNEIIRRLLKKLNAHPNRNFLTTFFDTEVTDLLSEDGKIVGVSAKSGKNPSFEIRAERTILASGGISGGNLESVKTNWKRERGPIPQILLNGSHRYADGKIHEIAKSKGAKLTHLDEQWLYAAGIHHPKKRKPFDGLSLVPPRSALWMNALGKRIGPSPLVGYTDTRYLVDAILKEPGQYSWQILNRKIALKELAVSGSDYMSAFRNKSKLRLLMDLLFGNRELVERLINECPDDIVIAQNLPELMKKMNEKSLPGFVIREKELAQSIHSYDEEIERGVKYFTDEQLRRLHSFRANPGDRIRICKFQKILDPKALPLIAIREFILTRKSLGGIQTDLECRVLKANGEHVPGLYSIGESAGFGGGGIHGKSSLEGTFLGACILTARVLASSIQKGY